MASPCRDLDFLWKEYFRDPEKFWDNPCSEKSRSPDLRHKQTRQARDATRVVEIIRPQDKSRVKARKFGTVRKTSQQEWMDAIQACGRRKDLHKGRKIHADIIKTGLLEKDLYISSTLVGMYAKCGALANAQEVFDGLSVRNEVSWNALIAGYAQHGLGQEALNLFERMQDEGFSPTRVTFLCILRACGSIGATKKGEEIHAEVRRLGLLEKHDLVLSTALVDMYAKCGTLAKAQEVFDGLPERDAISWNALITGYAQHGFGQEALNCFARMQDEGFFPDTVTFICILKACSSIGATEKGEEIHAEMRRLGLLEKHDVMLSTAVVDMYSKCGALAKAQEVFDGLQVRDAVSWNALITGYAQHGLAEEALNCLDQMGDGGFSPDAVTFTCILKACGSIGAIEKGEEIHTEVRRLGLLENDAALGTALVDMYAKCGRLSKAQEVFDGLPVRDVVTWNALITGYAQHGLAEEALNCFEWMRDEGFFPNAVTFACVLKACGSIGATEKGEEIYDEVCRLGLLEDHNIVLSTALLDMYAKCGALTKAQGVFDGLSVRDTVSWNSLMAGYGRLGKTKRVFTLFSKMRGECIEPDGVTFSILLTACSHAGLVDEGQMYFDIMSTVYCIIPNSEHYTGLIDIFSRAGHFDKAISKIEKVSGSDLWLALLGACRKWVNVELGRWAFEHVLQFDDKCGAAYVCMSNIYAAAGMQEEAHNIEALRTKNGAWKTPGHYKWREAG